MESAVVTMNPLFDYGNGDWTGQGGRTKPTILVRLLVVPVYHRNSLPTKVAL